MDRKENANQYNQKHKLGIEAKNFSYALNSLFKHLFYRTGFIYLLELSLAFFDCNVCKFTQWGSFLSSIQFGEKLKFNCEFRNVKDKNRFYETNTLCPPHVQLILYPFI